MLTIFLAILVFGGYLFPLPGIAMAWREWVTLRKVPPKMPWRRTITKLTLLFASAGIPLWAYAVTRELRNDYSYIFASARFGRWASLVLVAVSAFAEGKTRIFLLLVVVGFLLFFSCSIGELP